MNKKVFVVHIAFINTGIHFQLEKGATFQTYASGCQLLPTYQGNGND